MCDVRTRQVVPVFDRPADAQQHCEFELGLGLLLDGIEKLIKS